MLLELLLVGGLATAPIDTTAIKIFEENKIELVIPTPDPMTTLPEPEPVITPQEQLQINIDTNVNNCDESLYWISAENATCLAKPVYTQQSTVSTVTRAYSGSRGGYAYGNCTAYAQNSLGWVPNGWGNANRWDNNARAMGYTVSSTPRVGAVAQTDAGYYGHVAVVVAVHGTTVTVKEMNYVGFNVVSTRTAPTSSFVYIY